MMNEKLETINDIRKHRIETGCYKNIKEGTTLRAILDISHGVTIHDLKRLGIKIIKRIDDSIINYPEFREKCCHCNYDMNDKNNSDKKAQIFIIKTIFDITDEDMKVIK